MRTSWFTPVPPTVAVELASHRITVVEIPAGAPVVTAFATEPLPVGVIQPALTGVNIVDSAAVVDALKRTLDRAGLGAARRVALLVPDSAARVTLLPLDKMPARAQDLDQLVRWQIKKSTPFPLEEATVSHFVAASSDASLSVAAVVSRRDVLAQYEDVVSAAGLHPGVVDLSSLNVMNAAMAAGAPSGDWLLVHLAAEATTVAVLRGSSLLFYRHRTAVDEEPLGSLVHQTAMYHEDRLGGGGFEKVWLSGAGPAADEARWQISSRVGVPVEAIDLRPAADIRDRQSAGPDVLDGLTAGVGVLVRERRAA